MNMKQFPVIDPIATGKNIIRLRVERGMSVRDLQAYLSLQQLSLNCWFNSNKNRTRGSKPLVPICGTIFQARSLLPRWERYQHAWF